MSDHSDSAKLATFIGDLVALSSGSLGRLVEGIAAITAWLRSDAQLRAGVDVAEATQMIELLEQLRRTLAAYDSSIVTLLSEIKKSRLLMEQDQQQRPTLRLKEPT